MSEQYWALSLLGTPLVEAGSLISRVTVCDLPPVSQSRHDVVSFELSVPASTSIGYEAQALLDLPLGGWGTHSHTSCFGRPLASTTTPASDAPVVGESWPKDTLHDAARQVVRGAKDLAPAARKAVTDAVHTASAPPTGRAASDGAVGRALGARLTAYGLRTSI